MWMFYASVVNWTILDNCGNLNILNFSTVSDLKIISSDYGFQVELIAFSKKKFVFYSHSSNDV
jgi:hypothetical protein